MDWQKFSNIGAFVVAVVFLGVQSYVWYKHGDIGVSSLAMLGVIAMFLFAAGIINYKAFHTTRPASQEAPKSSESRIVFDHSPSYLVAQYQNTTSAQGDRLVRPYIGKWMKVSDKIGNVRHLDNGYSQISFTSFSEGGVHVIMLFDKHWRDRVSVLIMGQKITVLGQLAQVDGSSVVLRQCELIEVSTST